MKMNLLNGLEHRNMKMNLLNGSEYRNMKINLIRRELIHPTRRAKPQNQNIIYLTVKV